MLLYFCFVCVVCVFCFLFLFVCLFVFLFVCMVWFLDFFETGILYMPLAVWNSLCKTCWPCTQKSAYVCLPRAGIKAVHHQHPANIAIFSEIFLMFFLLIYVRYFKWCVHFFSRCCIIPFKVCWLLLTNTGFNIRTLTFFFFISFLSFFSV